MDQRVPNQRDALRSLIAFIAESVAKARAVEKPFYHLEFDRVFPEDIYAQMVAAMPVAADYRPLRGRNNGNMRDDGRFVPRVHAPSAAGQTGAVGPRRASALLQRGSVRVDDGAGIGLEAAVR